MGDALMLHTTSNPAASAWDIAEHEAGSEPFRDIFGVGVLLSTYDEVLRELVYEPEEN
jgi:hypothetical protein